MYKFSISKIFHTFSYVSQFYSHKPLRFLLLNLLSVVITSQKEAFNNQNYS